MGRRERVAALVLALPGGVAPFLPFTLGLSPLFAVLNVGWFYLAWIPPATLLAWPIAAWQVRRLMVARLSIPEVALAYVLSAAAMLSALAFAISLSIEDIVRSSVSWPVLILEILVLASPLWGLAGANVLLLVRNLRRRVPREVAAEAFLLGGYFPATVFPLIPYAIVP